MSCIGCGSSKHTLTDRKCTTSLEQIKTSLMNRNFPAYQTEAIAHLHSNRVMSSIRHSQTSSSSSEIPICGSKENQARILKDKNNKTTAPSHIRHLNILDELLDSVVEQGLECYLSLAELDRTMNEDETTTTYISFSIYQIHTIELMILCVDTGAHYSCNGEKAIEMIFRHSGR